MSYYKNRIAYILSLRHLDYKLILSPQGLSTARRGVGRKVIEKRQIVEMHSKVRFLFALLVLGLTISCGSGFRRHLDIKVEDVPIYNNAERVTRVGPSNDFGKVYIWSFTTTDMPSTVWLFYKGEMSHEWGFYDPSPDDGRYLLIVNTCPFYYLEMENTPIDIKTYKITIKFGEEPCR